MAKTAQEKADLKAEKLYEKTHKRKYRLKPGDIVFNILNYLFFTLFTIACIFPFYYLFINTISDNDLVIKGLINFIPRGIHFDNYTALLNVSDLSSALIVSLSRTVLGTALMVAASGFIGYLVTKDEMWGRKFWYRFLVITMYFNAGLIPWFLNMQMLGLTNTFWHTSSLVLWLRITSSGKNIHRVNSSGTRRECSDRRSKLLYCIPQDHLAAQ